MPVVSALRPLNQFWMLSQLDVRKFGEDIGCPLSGSVSSDSYGIAKSLI
jgi:hypothetical protein